MNNSPNTSIRPITARTNSLGHLEIGGADTTVLAEQFGTPLWIMDEATIAQSANACKDGLKDSKYPDWQVLYAGKAFLCLAMCRLTEMLDLGLDVVSYGELHTAMQAGLSGESVYLHGNNKSREEIETAIANNVRIVVDCESELHLIAELAKAKNTTAKILLRVTPGVEPDTHHYIKTGQHDSKFGLALEEVTRIAKQAQTLAPSVLLLGLHAHIGSQSHDIGPYLDIVDIMADSYAELKSRGVNLTHLDVGGGLGITYTEQDKATPIYDWSRAIGKKVQESFQQRNLTLPKLLVEPGRAIVGTAGVTIYRAGNQKVLPGDLTYVSIDGGMADNPRPVTYQAKYSACVANRNENSNGKRITLVGKFCESGDVLIKNIQLNADTGDLIAVFSTGAYNYSMSSNYNRTGRPACVLVKDGVANVIIERENADDLLRQDRIPDYLRAKKARNCAV
ncbi:MAG: diaminopimelate decarboxylase [Candidatus Obscuribacterales bacterium]|nr:diaminopimelate decarboxylase [Candidatus Obscuribacterales bacterium]